MLDAEQMKQLIKWKQREMALELEVLRLERDLRTLTDLLKREQDKRAAEREIHRGCTALRYIAVRFGLPQTEVIKAMDEAIRICQAKFPWRKPGDAWEEKSDG